MEKPKTVNEIWSERDLSAILIMTLAQLHKDSFRHFQTPSNFAANR